MLKDYNGKKFTHCYAMGQRINLNQDGTISLCHGIEVGDYVVDKHFIGKRLNRKWFEQHVGDAVKRSFCGQNHFCEGCSNYIDQKYEFDGLKVITINTSNLCNCRCVYCNNWAANNRNRSYDPLPYIKQLEKEGLINKNCMFDWGGGEPTINKYFERTASYLNKNGYIQRVNTNAVVFSDFLGSLVRSEKCFIRTSLDSGDRETFFNVKGYDGFSATCDNIIKYAKGNESSICIKYVLNRANRSENSIKGFLDFCKRTGLNDIILDADLNSYSYKNYSGPVYFSQEELNSAHYFMNYARKLGLNPKIGYVYTAYRGITGRDYNVEQQKNNQLDYDLPTEICKSKLIKNISPKGILPEPFASIEAITHKYGYKIAVIEDGMMGKILTNRLKKCDFKIEYRINEQIPKDEFNIMINSIIEKKIPIIICSIRFNTTIHQLNSSISIPEDKRNALSLISIDPYRLFWGTTLFDVKNILLKIFKRTIYREKDYET